MTDSGLDLVSGGGGERPPGRGRRRAEKPQRNGGKWIGRVIALVVVVALVLGAWKGYQKVEEYFNGPEDYTGQGTGSVVVEVPEGAVGADIADILYEDGVVASAEAFYQLTLQDSSAQGIQPGFYKLRKQMSSEWALKELADRANRVEGKVTITEGARIDQVIDAVAANTEISEKEVTAVLEKPDDIGLPSAAKGNPEGYLYPATYTVEPGTSATQLLRQMVDKTLQVEKDLDLEARSEALGYTSEQILTVASLLEYEAQKDEDYPKVARVIYNRLDDDMPLQFDSTVSYVSGRKGDVWTTQEERDAESAYNTYQNAGLPPGPIGSPGEKTIEAALNPAQGSWLFFFATKDGKVVYNDTYNEHLKDCQAAYGAGSCGG